MQTGRIDVHGHLLPGIDDGCSDYEESFAVARALTAAGYTHAFCTPHVWPSLPNNNVAGIRAAVAKLREQLGAAEIPLKVMGGGELNLLQLGPLLPTLADSEIVTYGLGSKYMLFDFWTEEYAECKAPLEAAVTHLHGRGFQLILAHPERIGAIQNSPDAISSLADLGVLFQLNSWCLGETAGSVTRQLATRLLEEGRYFLIGTDLHKPSGMEARLGGIEIAEQIAGREAIRKLTIENPHLLLPTIEIS